MAYERKFGRYLKCRILPFLDGARLYSGQWIQFYDDSGPGFAQPDHILKTPQSVWIFENKLTYREEGWNQLNYLYGPLLSAIFDLPQVLVQVVKNVGGDDWLRSGRSGDLSRLPNLTEAGRVLTGGSPGFLFHWLGV